MDLAGKTVVVTGGTSGIGRAAAIALAARGADVTIIGRDPVRGAATAAELIAASGGAGRFLPADLSLVRDARRVVAELTATIPRLDAFVSSAAVLELSPSSTPEGFGTMYATNFLTKLVLAEGIAPHLAASHGRLVVVAADFPRWIGVDWKNFDGARRYSGSRALARLNAATLAVVQELAERWRGAGLEVFALHPGQVQSGLFREFRGPWKLVQAFLSVFAVPVELPAKLVSWLAFSPDAAGATGQLFRSVKNYDKRRVLARDPAMVERVLASGHAAIASIG